MQGSDIKGFSQFLGLSSTNHGINFNTFETKNSINDMTLIFHYKYNNFNQSEPLHFLSANEKVKT